MRTRLLLWLITVFTVWSGFAQAQSTLERATEYWLKGRDQKSLIMLAELARAGNADARLLLGRIETTDLGPSPFRMSLSKDETRALFRDISEHTLFGKTWISVEAALGNEYAHAFLRAAQPVPRLGLIERLNRLQEYQAADHPTRIVALYGNQSMRDKLRASEFLMSDLEPYLDYLSGTPEPRGDGLAVLRHIAPDLRASVSADDAETLGMAGILSLGYGYGDHSSGNRWRAPVESWLLSSPSTKPIADLCAVECGGAKANCAFAFLALSGGYFEAIRVDSPFEKLIPQAQFVSSHRARIMVLRRAALARSETNLTWLADHKQIAEISECAADLIINERQKYQ
ncbi:hypothetical protein [uncultured Roseovarius sp.]|uniref:hypothetical protein n=1 Tax=uncultured Roseovarius sp. TaxID=293344 RepID=UPI002601CF12|nr:hypothetical protein [uncultured Roseovarius sp.]